MCLTFYLKPIPNRDGLDNTNYTIRDFLSKLSGHEHTILLRHSLR